MTDFDVEMQGLRSRIENTVNALDTYSASAAHANELLYRISPNSVEGYSLDRVPGGLKSAANDLEVAYRKIVPDAAPEAMKESYDALVNGTSMIGTAARVLEEAVNAGFRGHAGVYDSVKELHGGVFAIGQDFAAFLEAYKPEVKA